MTGSDDEDKGKNEKWLTERSFFLAVALLLLLITTARFSGDIHAFAWSLVVLGGVMYLDRV